MLPRINTQQRPKLTNHSILIRVRLDADSASLCILDQPRPAGALDACERGVELLFQSIEATEAVVDGCCETAGGWITAAAGFWGEVFPEEGVVCVAA